MRTECAGCIDIDWVSPRQFCTLEIPPDKDFQFCIGCLLIEIDIDSQFSSERHCFFLNFSELFVCLLFVTYIISIS